MPNWLYQLMRQLSLTDRVSKADLQQNHLNMLNAATIVLEERPGVWQVEYAGSFWYAYSSKQSIFHIGDIVQVIGREGISLLIDKAEE